MFLKVLKTRKFQFFAIDFAVLTMCGVMSYFIASSVKFVHIRPIDILPGFLVSVLLNMICLVGFKVYQNIWKYARISEFFDCIAAIAVGSVVSQLIIELTMPWVCSIFMLVLYMTSVIAIVVTRCMYYYVNVQISKRDMEKRKRTMIVGAGDACRQIIDEMLRSYKGKYNPVVIVDDAEKRQKRRINGIPIGGTTKEIPVLCRRYGVQNIIFAIPSCNAKDKKRIMAICTETNCTVKTLPSLQDMLESDNLVSKIQPVKIDDLLGRDVIKLNNPLLHETISDKVCMVTGGGGSIGSELSRQIAKNTPKKLVIVDIYENNAYDIQQELVRKYGDELDLCVEIASVRDYDKLELLFQKYRPQMVFHAAAHKHVPLMETNPEEAIKNNIFGTYNAATLAKKYESEKFVLVSTDKAVNPTNVMGATKRCCEMIVQHLAQKEPKTAFVAVRFGNVLGSNGSVIPLFEKQIAEGRPITVTHPDIIRYFMTIPEAVSLILEAATMARGGEIFVLDMGEPVKILELAENLIKMHGKEPYTEVEIKFTGLRPGEKLFEELLMDEEGLRSTANNRIFVGQQISVNSEEFKADLTELKELANNNDTDACVDKLAGIVPTFKRALNNAEAVVR